jgi:hypothetical protein
MIRPDQLAPEHYLTPKFFDAAHALGATGIRYNVDLAHEVDAFVRQETGSGLPAAADRLDFAYFLVGGRLPRDWDTHFFEADPWAAYIPVSELSGPAETRRAVRKDSITDRGRTVLEIQAGDLTQPLTGALVRAITTPPPEEARLASGKGWVGVVKRAFTGEGLRDGFSPTHRHSGRKDLEAEAIRRFPGALVLERPNA